MKNNYRIGVGVRTCIARSTLRVEANLARAALTITRV